MVNQNPKQIACDKADALLEASGWAVQDIKNSKLKEPRALVQMIADAAVPRHFNTFSLDFTATPGNRSYSFFKKTVVSYCNPKKVTLNIENGRRITTASQRRQQAYYD